MIRALLKFILKLAAVTLILLSIVLVIYVSFFEPKTASTLTEQEIAVD